MIELIGILRKRERTSVVVRKRVSLEYFVGRCNITTKVFKSLRLHGDLLSRYIIRLLTFKHKLFFNYSTNLH